MRAGADPGIFAIAPVDEIMPAFGAGARMVRDLIGGQARRVHHLLRRVPEIAAKIRAGNGEFSGCAEALEHRAGLDGELVKREMIACERKRAGKLGAPFGDALARPRIDQIERDALENPAGEATAAIASALVCMRPRPLRSASFKACMPSETRLTPAAR